MIYYEFLDLAKKAIANRIHVGEGSFESYKEYVESYKSNHSEIIDQYGITESELFVMFMMITKNYDEIQQQFFSLGRSTPFTKECARQYDSFLSKVPVSSSSTHYRLERYYKVGDFEKLWKFGQCLVCRHYLTVSSSSSIFEKMGDGVKLYINRPIIDKDSKAHEVFKIYNGTNENQINYERNTRFQINSVERSNKIVILTEL